MVGQNFSNSLKMSGLRGSDDEHQIFRAAPGGCFSEYIFKKRFAGFEFLKLKIEAAAIRGQTEYDGPFSLKTEERADGIFAHVRCHRERICPHFFKKSGRVKPRGVADIAAFGIGDDEMVGADFADNFFKRQPARRAEGLEKREVRFEGHAMRFRRVNYLSAKFKNGVFKTEQMSGQLRHFRVEADAEHRFFLENMADEGGSSHADFFEPDFRGPR